MATADFHSRCISRYKCQSDAEIDLLAQQLIRVVQLEGEPEQGCHRAEGDVTLFPVEPDAKHVFLAFEFAAADHAPIGNAGGIRTGFGTGERKTRHLLASRQARQKVVFLRVGAVTQQQFRRPQRIGHHHRDAGRDTARGGLHHHRRVRERGELETAVLLRNDHAEEAFVLEKLPHLGRQIAPHMRDVPVVEHATEFLDRAIDKCLLLGRQLRLGHAKQFFPTRCAVEQLRFPPHRAGFECLALGIRHRRHDALEQREHRLR